MNQIPEKSDARSVVALVGSPGSGKTTVAERLTSDGYLYYSISDVRRTVALAFNMNINDFDAMKQFTVEFYENRGKGVFTDFALQNMACHNWQKAVLEGLRSPEAVRVAREFCSAQGWSLICVGLRVEPELATSRIVARGRRRDPHSVQAVSDYATAASAAADAALALCDKVIINDSTKEILLEQVAQYIASSKTSHL